MALPPGNPTLHADPQILRFAPVCGPVIPECDHAVINAYDAVASRDINNPMMLWIELNMKLKDLCRESLLPLDIMKRIWGYFEWCLQHRDDDVMTAAAVGFCEHLIDTPERAQLLPSLMTKDDYLGFRELLLHHNSEEDYKSWLLKLWPVPG